MTGDLATSRKKGGFTLLELLAGMVITFLLIGVIGYAFSSASRTTQKSAQRVDTWREARGALAIMERDLRSVARFAAGEGSGSVPPTLVMAFPPTVPDDQRANEEIRFLSFQAAGGMSDLCMVGYRCVWDPNERCYALRRLLLNDEKTRLGVREFDAATSALEGALYASPDIVEEEVARYVWDLTFRPVEANGAVALDYPDREYRSDLPVWVEIRFKAVGEKAVQMLKTLPVTQETWARQDDPVHQRIILPSQYQFVIRVRLDVAGKLP